MAVKKRKAKFVLKLTTSGKSFNTLDEVFSEVLVNMYGHATGSLKAFVLLCGDVGIGKTSIIRSISRIMGMNMVLLEAPSIGEEDIIEIPFLVFKANNPQTPQENIVSTGVKKDDNVEVDITYVESKLIQKLKSLRPLSLDKAKRFLRNENEKKIFEKYEDMIKEVRETYDTIFFLDDYRTGNKNTQHMLRNFLHGEYINTIALPENVYPIISINYYEKNNTPDDFLRHEEFGCIMMDKYVDNDVFIDYMKKKLEAEISDKINSKIKGSIDEEIDVNNIDELNIPEKTKKEIKNYVKSAEVIASVLKSLSDEGINIYKRNVDIEIEEAPSRISPRRTEYILRYTANNMPQNTEELKKYAYYLYYTLGDYKTLHPSNKVMKFITKMVEGIAKKQNIDIDIKKFFQEIENSEKD